MTENFSAKARATGKSISAKHGNDTAIYHPNGSVIMLFGDDSPEKPDYSSITREVAE